MHDGSGLASRVFPPDRPGDSPPVLLLHSFASDGAADWVETGVVAALTGAGRTVVVPDLRGHGDSPAPAAAHECGARAVAEDIVAVLDRAGVTAFDVVGYSLGARLGWELPAAAPGRVRRAVFGGLSPVEPFAAVDVAALHRAVRDGAEPEDPFTAMIAGMVRSCGERAAGLALCVEGLRDTPFEAAPWGGPTPPVFVIGEDDVMTRGIERIVSLVGGAEPIIVPGGHFQVLGGAAFRDTIVRVLGQ
ncbi:alpha/beta hydrolase fold [Streptosporangium canum]|uniref:Alpha/beta hydrolase fold n=1 Tax=Streptosporangium canum TaxID=324952 RepID=A0A1I3ZCJ9_9ACTN|nr:alpha/beta hydrolase fold [Streptosporangium canum]